MSKIKIGSNLKLGVALSEEKYRSLLSGILAKKNLTLFIEIQRYDNATNDFVILESRQVMDSLSLFLNNTFVFEGNAYQSGRYKFVMRYESWLERIEQEYEYYLEFDQ